MDGVELMMAPHCYPQCAFRTVGDSAPNSFSFVMSQNAAQAESSTAQGVNAAVMPRPIAKLVAIVLAATTLGFAGSTAYLYRQNQQLKNPDLAAQAELRSVLKRVSKFMTLPEGEEPTLATVTRPEELKKEAFFAKTKKGDKLLIYTQARLVVLYDPLENKVLNVGPLSPDAVKNNDAASPVVTDEKTQQ